MISARSRYSLKIMIYLASHRDKPSSVAKICKSLGLPKKYCEQIMGVLNAAGFVSAKLGARGGYSLTRIPDTYRAGDIIRLFEGSLLESAQGANDAETAFWKALSAAADSVLDRYTLSALISGEE